MTMCSLRLRYCCFLILFSALQLIAQNKSFEGRLLNQANEPLPYATVLNSSNGLGAISNDLGYFEIPLNSDRDSIRISYIGFKTKWIVPRNLRSEIIVLDDVSNQLEAVTISPKDYSRYIDLFIDCREKVHQVDTSKAYLQLKSFIGPTQVELLEGFYNAKVKGIDLLGLELKTARLGVRKYNNQFFTSQSSSRAITSQKLRFRDAYFPEHPYYMSAGRINRKYILELKEKVLSDAQDTLINLYFYPKKGDARFFEFTAWINVNQKRIEQIALYKKNLKIHPFLPLFEIDKIEQINLEIIKRFKHRQDGTYLSHIDFDYQLRYNSRGQQIYPVHTKLILELYDFEQQFTLPLKTFNTEKLTDYKIINAYPFYENFWKQNRELKMIDYLNKNESFLSDTATKGNHQLFFKNKGEITKFHQHTFIHWNEKRLLFKPNQDSLDFGNTLLNLSAEYYLDKDILSDSIVYLSKTIINPFLSYYNKEVDRQANCFINIFFDLAEMNRREMMKEIRTKGGSDYESIMNEYVKKLELLKLDYFTDTKFGNDLEAMKAYNEMVYKSLNIDNIKLFRLEGF